MKHAKLSPSGAHRWLACPGAVAANANKPFEQNVHALLGTSAHALLEVCLRLDMDPEDSRFLGKKLDHDLLPVDEEMAEAVGHAADYVRAYLADNPKAKLLIEQQVFMDASLGITAEDATCWGTSDVIIDNWPKECVVIDYKHGVGRSVSVKKNPQLRLYSVGQRQARGRYQRYRNVVVQPRLRGRKPVQETTLTDKELMEWVGKEVMPIIPIALSSDAPRHAGDHCTYCHANGNCPEQYRLVLEAAKKEFANADPKALTPAELAHIMDLFGPIEEVYKAVKTRVVAAVHAGVDIPGYEAEWTNTKRIWLTPEKAEAQLRKMGLENPFAPPELLSPAQAEKALKTAGKWPKTPRGTAKVDPFEMAEVIARTEANPTVRKKA